MPQKVADAYLNVALKFPDEWNTHVGHGYCTGAQDLFDKNKRNAGFLHFSGANIGTSYFSDIGLIKFCIRAGDCNHTDTSRGGDVEKFDRTWGIAVQYVKLIWDWVRYQGGLSRIHLGGKGHAFRYVKRVLN